ncbi:MAG TPA: hypothetical protein VH701_19240 [Vicinamibacterales bacterium]
MGLPAEAQTAGVGKWEVEFHVGGIRQTNPTGGTATLPGPGQVFMTGSGVSNPPPSSRRASSWYFGDGALLFNQAASSLAMQATSPLGLSSRIATLDPVLGSALGRWQSGGTIGVSVSRALTPRLSAELSLDYSLQRLQITQPNSDAIEATRASFIPAWAGVITANSNRVLNSLTSTATFDNGNRHQFLVTSSLVVNLRTTGRVVPYATVGAGVLAITGKAPSATLNGNYRFLLPSAAPIDETDSVTVTDASRNQTLAGTLGGGVKYQVSPRWGLRIDVRLVLSKNTARTIVDATPSVALGQRPAGRGVLGAEPSIQFSNNASEPVTALGVTAVASSTLTGPAITELRTFSGSGVSTHPNLTVGIIWRF